MELDVKRIPQEASRCTVIKAIARILHSEDFSRSPDPDERPANFQVQLNESKLGGVRNNGSGVLTLMPELGRRFWKYTTNTTPVLIDGHKLKFFITDRKPPLGLAMTLEKAPYIDPDQEEERQGKLYELQEQLRIEEVQFGVFYRSYPKRQNNIVQNRAFSVECARNYASKSLGWLHFDYDHKLIYIELGDKMTEQIGTSISVKFSSIDKIALGYDGNPAICFDTFTPPILEEIDFNRPITGDETLDNKKYRRRVGSLHPGHKAVASYAHQLRIVLYNDPNVDMVEKFKELCHIAGLDSPLYHVVVDACRQQFFIGKKLFDVKNWLKKLPWFMAFQLEAMLRNGRLNTRDLMCNLRPLVDRLHREHPDTADNVLCYFNEELEVRPPKESPVECFKRICNRRSGTHRAPLYSKFFYCHHVTITPTRFILEGPFATQSNRVVRLYEGFEENFLRVDFREEDGLHYRWGRELDATTFLNERVGGILKGGFELAGRQFEFLAYSNSALREHAVWFMRPFEHPERGWVTSDKIRASLGDFSSVLRQPSKYAARMAQAFTATDPSITIRRDEWKEIADIGDFTDGVGTISPEMRDSIWNELCASRRDHGKNAIKPDVYQIRFLGYKGVVVVDEHLEGKIMCLRVSMRKFNRKEGEEHEDAPIEIARAFGYPNMCYLNKATVMILEDRGVRKEAFLDLQQSAIAEARMIDDSIEQFCKVLKVQGCGKQFRLCWIMERLKDLHLDLTDLNNAAVITDGFLARVRRVVMNDILRDIKHRARIPVPKSYQLVGVADEGTAYIKEGVKNVFTLEEGQIYACIQSPGDTEPTYLKGNVCISRNPVVHPGDLQRVYAIGKPPPDKVCFFGNLKNVVVFSTVGRRSLPNCLAGGDLDGDTYDIIQFHPLLPPIHYPPGTYDSVGIREIDTDSTVDDICEFIVEYIHSDVLGLLCDRHLLIADQSKQGTMDPDCLKLARLCSQAVDYPKNGIPVNLDEHRLPHTLIRFKPDWTAAEVVSPRQSDYYKSTRALGYLYRAIDLEDPNDIVSETEPAPLTDAISLALMPLIQSKIPNYTGPDDCSLDIGELLQRYKDELQYICTTHTLSDDPSVRLLEEEIVVGTILAKCTQQRWRRSRIYRMALCVSALVNHFQCLLEGDPELDPCGGLERAWAAWELCSRHKEDFGTNSFGLIALGVIFDALDRLSD